MKIKNFDHDVEADLITFAVEFESGTRKLWVGKSDSDITHSDLTAIAAFMELCDKQHLVDFIRGCEQILRSSDKAEDTSGYY